MAKGEKRAAVPCIEYSALDQYFTVRAIECDVPVGDVPLCDVFASVVVISVPIISNMDIKEVAPARLAVAGAMKVMMVHTLL